ncbi:MAG: EipA family protein [Pseudomonadota bacterium]
MTACARWLFLAIAALGLAALTTGPLAAQDLEVFDPNEAFTQPAAPAPVNTQADTGVIDADLMPSPTTPVPNPAPAQPTRVPQAAMPDDAQGIDNDFALYSQPTIDTQTGVETLQWVDPASGASVGPADAANEAAPVLAANDAAPGTYGEDDLIGAAEGVFGKGAKGLAKLIEDLLKKEGQPNGYIVGREAGGAFIVGARYGSGTLHHKVEGERKVYWTGPSVGFDAGANAANTFVLVYNLYDSEDLFKRYPSGEGQAYFVGGLHASFMRRGDVVLIPIRMGAGLRLGVNAGYMKFSKKQRWLPF